MSYKVGDFFIRNDKTPEDGSMFMVRKIDHSGVENVFKTSHDRYEIVGLSVIDGRVLNYFWESNESLYGDFIKYYPSEEEKAFFLLKLENTEND